MNIDDIIESAQLKGRVIALNAQVETLTAEVRCLEAVIRSHERVDCLTVANLKAEVERLESDLKLEKENEDRLVRLWQTANNEVHGQRSQIAALIDNQTSLKAEVERLTPLLGDIVPFNEYLEEKEHAERLHIENSILMKETARLQAEVARLRKAGIAMGMCLPDTDEANKAYRDFEAGGRS
jgi:chromosome segregation ATPase